ncbi:MAG TPA: hypothetical protein ENJ37_04845 [Deltaproteobacteria bacterium]|nr:hypothetical protein [Deltaproteobacteria bacterium]
MADFIDRAILIGIGLEKKAKQMMDELAALGSRESGEGAEAEEELSARQRIENKVVDEGVAALREIISVLREGKEKLDREVVEKAELLLERLHVATTEELDVVKEMARTAREKVDKLERRVKKLEEKLKEKKDKDKEK